MFHSVSLFSQMPLAQVPCSTEHLVLQVMWRRPDGSIPVGALDGSGTSYINTVIMSATDLSSGNYTCAASLNSSVVFLTSSTDTTASLTIEIGKIFIIVLVSVICRCYLVMFCQ